MRRCVGLALLPVLLGMFSGCTWMDQAEPSSWIKRFHDQTISPDHAVLKVAIIERPMDDEFINRELWLHADGLVVLDAERRGALDENGFRVATLVGPPPADYQDLLLSSHCCRNSQKMMFPAGQAKHIYLSSVLPRSSYDVVQDKRRTEVTLGQSRFCLEVTAHFVDGGRTKLTIVPKVETDEAVLPFRAVPDRSAWEYRIEKASRRYPDLGWEVTLEPNQDLLIGTRPERVRTLGASALLQQEGSLYVQRLLVIRNCRSATPQGVNESTTDEPLRSDRAMPLALQASMSAHRGKP